MYDLPSVTISTPRASRIGSSRSGETEGAAPHRSLALQPEQELRTHSHRLQALETGSRTFSTPLQKSTRSQATEGRRTPFFFQLFFFQPRISVKMESARNPIH